VEELIKKAEEEGIDVEDIIINAIRNKSEDPSISIKLRIEIAENTLMKQRNILKTEI
jgi:hypothetical protein